MERYEFELLKYVEKEDKIEYCARTFSDALNISGATLNMALEKAVESHWINKEGNVISITEEGKTVLEPYRVRRAVILAAGLDQEWFLLH